MEILINWRKVLDHNRIWNAPISRGVIQISKSTRVYTFERIRIPNYLIEDSLLGHIERWVPYISKFGLLVIELHTVPKEIVAEHIGKTAVTAYDATNRFSNINILSKFLYLIKYC